MEIVSQEETERDSRSKKVVPCEKRRGRWKVVGNVVVRGDHPLKGEMRRCKC